MSLPVSLELPQPATLRQKSKYRVIKTFMSPRLFGQPQPPFGDMAIFQLAAAVGSRSDLRDYETTLDLLCSIFRWLWLINLGLGGKTLLLFLANTVVDPNQQES